MIKNSIYISCIGYLPQSLTTRIYWRKLFFKLTLSSLYRFIQQAIELILNIFFKFIFCFTFFNVSRLSFTNCFLIKNYFSLNFASFDRSNFELEKKSEYQNPFDIYVRLFRFKVYIRSIPGLNRKLKRFEIYIKSLIWWHFSSKILGKS